MIDLERIRLDTIGVDDIVHLNNCGSSLPPGVVVDAQVDYLRHEQRMGGYEAAIAFEGQLHDFSAATAEMLGCSTDEVAFQGNASEAWWRAFTAIPLAPGDRVLVGTSEFQAAGFALLQARARGVDVVVIPNDETGTIDLDALSNALDERVRLVCLTQIAMSNGAIHPAAAVGALCRSARVPFLLDACQAAGQLPLDVDELGCDFLAYTGRKFMRGPRGTGVLYARRSTVDQLGPTPFVDGISAEWHDDDTVSFTPGAGRFEWGERNYAGQVGLAVATRYALDIGLEVISERVGSLARQLRTALRSLSDVEVLDEGVHQSGIVTFQIDGVSCDAVAAALARDHINVGSPGRRNAQWDLGRRGLSAVVRVGVHYFNTEAELERLTDAVAQISAADRSQS